MKLAKILNEVALNPERVFFRDSEEGRHVISANKKGEILQELHNGGSKKRVQIKVSVFDNDEWFELIEKISWKDALNRYAVEGKGFRLVRSNEDVVLQSPEDKLGVFVNGEPGFEKEDFVTGEFFRHYDFEKVLLIPEDVLEMNEPEPLFETELINDESDGCSLN